MSPTFSPELAELFAEEILKCVLRDSNIPWNHRWGVQRETRGLLPDLNICRGLISESVTTASRRYRPIIMEEGSYVWDGVMNSSDTGLLLPSLITAGRKLGNSEECFFIFMAIVNDLCIRFYRAEQSHLIADVFKAVVHIMTEMCVFTPEMLERDALAFLKNMTKKSP